MKTWHSAVQSLIDDPAQRALAEACYFDPPLARAAQRYADGPEWAAIQALINEFGGASRGIAIDIGAGNGIVSYALARDGWQTVAIEPDPSDLVGAGAIRRLARETGVSIDVRAGFGEGLPVESGTAALVVARQVLHHATDLPAFTCEIARILTPGGLLVCARDHVISGPEQLQPFLDGHPLHRYYGGENAFRLVNYRQALTDAGLRIEREIGSLGSVINYAPHTPETLRAEIANRLGPIGPVVEAGLTPAPILGVALRLLSAVDRRPGRLVSFVCRKG